jgi:cytochrome c
MKGKVLISMVGMMVVSLVLAGPALCDLSKKDLAESLAKQGAAYMAANGIEKSVEAFKTGDFKQGDIFLFAYNYDGVCVAHGVKEKQIGKNLSKLKTPEGEYHIQNLIGLAKKGGGWHEYRWMHPKKKKLMEKESLIMPVDGMDAFVGCGWWK